MYKFIAGAALVATVAIVAPARNADANLFNMPKSLKPPRAELTFERPTLAPMAHTKFCIENPVDCQVRRISFRGRKFDLTPQRMIELDEINRNVNRAIRPERNKLGLMHEKWVISPISGDCNDYAVTKRHHLIEKGWPSHSLLLAEVVTGWGEHHLVVVARTRQGDFVLDNLTSALRSWSEVPYRWVRIQSPANPEFWSKPKVPAGRSA